MTEQWKCVGCGAARRTCECPTGIVSRQAANGQREYLSINEALNERQLRALRIGEQALEDLPVRDRDDLIMKGLAVRAWPKVTDAFWKTWLTPDGAALRLRLFDPTGATLTPSFGRG